MKTAMQQFFERVKGGSTTYTENFKKQFLEIEKNQLINAYDQDLYGGASGNRKFQDGKEYFAETFNT